MLTYWYKHLAQSMTTAYKSQANTCLWLIKWNLESWVFILFCFFQNKQALSAVFHCGNFAPSSFKLIFYRDLTSLWNWDILPFIFVFWSHSKTNMMFEFCTKVICSFPNLKTRLGRWVKYGNTDIKKHAFGYQHRQVTKPQTFSISCL